jgi:hypothetical protein
VFLGIFLALSFSGFDGESTLPPTAANAHRWALSDDARSNLFSKERRNFSMRFVLGVFIVLHGLVHLLYFGQSARYFELKPGMIWPDGSWAFSKLLGNEAARNLASISLVLAALGFIVGGIGLLVNQAWWRPVVVGGAVFSSLVYILFWNGSMQNMDGQGLVGILIDMAILLAVLLFRWPATE